MIAAAVGIITQQLNQHFRRAFDLNEDIAVASNILDQDGSVAQGVTNKLALFLVNIEKEAVANRHAVAPGATFDRVAVGSNPVFLNLYLMMAANFADYSEALKFISRTVGFFQRVPVLDHQNTPDLDQRIGRLALDIENLSIHDLSTLWGVLSGRYLPSVLYKVRLVVFDGDDVRGLVPRVVQPEPAVGR
jgi:hypothetical protein